MPEIINFRNIPKGTWPAHAVRIDRATPWGNKFSHLDYGKGEIKVPTREIAVQLYCLLADPLGAITEPQGPNFVSLEAREVFNKLDLTKELEESLFDQGTWIREHIHELAGMDLVCWCAPQACHGDVLMRLANES